ncbi:hypothetical protein K4K49_011878 [Colletotrichum sp. SAR 10_70]|nr:hypothetical protein K4K50_012132 [Colletotrichum sp. SAR 10_71]KAI8150875.1 hypothetical protein K4K49_011878 [Colletotrichum sp. SAR 10_70]KAI8171852.1 hypothetical protein K4K51_011936 [Colletotrichum sp. SAR 10_75]KAI8182918.1 hypothetical protein KHU50_002284 [Colletotrichum sp. SAR 10_65]KAI8216203.1 hypothetical protein K4K54_013264 [Colletotrichum sp. SAR 10_86]KAJ4994550.1 hypothetical protein K4K48_012830 [Colletotrichum sp. SAR 10_66]
MATHSDYNDIKTTAKDIAVGVYNYGQRQINRVVSFDTRQRAYSNVSNFAQERPLLFAFIVAQAIFSSLPIIVFSTFAVSTIVFALGAAVIFALFWVGVALLVLVPTLFFTCSVGILVWTWAAGSYLLARWLYEMSPVSAKGGLEVETPNGQKFVVGKDEDGFEAHKVKGRS